MIIFKTSAAVLLFLVLSIPLVPEISADEIQDLENRLQYLKEKKVIENQITELRSQLKALDEKYKDVAVTKKIEPAIAPQKPVTERKISAQEFIDLIVGNTLLGQGDNGNRFKTFFQRKGRLILNGETGGFYDEGTWEVVGNKMCVQWKKIRKGQYFCNSNFVLSGEMVSYTQELLGKTVTGKIAQGTNVGYQDIK